MISNHVRGLKLQQEDSAYSSSVDEDDASCSTSGSELASSTGSVDELPGSTAPVLVCSPPVSVAVVAAVAPNLIDRLVRSAKPTLVVPPAAILPEIFSGSVLDNFRRELEGIDLDNCEAHGENAFFVCDLAEVYRQHMRWQRELGDRVDAFFGMLFANALVSAT